MPTIDELTVADAPESWAALGFDVEAEGCALGGVQVRFAAAGAEQRERARAAGGSTGILGWSLRGIGEAQLDGLPTASSAAPPRAPGPPHPNGVVAIDHIVAVSPAFERSVERFVAAGMDLRRVREQP